MTIHSSAPAQEETPHETEITTILISDALRRRAQSLIKDRSIDGQSRALIRYALENSDAWLAEIVRLFDAGKSITAELELSETPETNEENSSEEKIEVLAEIICRAGDEPERKSAAVRAHGYA